MNNENKPAVEKKIEFDKRELCESIDSDFGILEISRLRYMEQKWNFRHCMVHQKQKTANEDIEVGIQAAVEKSWIIWYVPESKAVFFSFFELSFFQWTERNGWFFQIKKFLAQKNVDCRPIWRIWDCSAGEISVWIIRIVKKKADFRFSCDLCVWSPEKSKTLVIENSSTISVLLLEVLLEESKPVVAGKNGLNIVKNQC